MDYDPTGVVLLMVLVQFVIRRLNSLSCVEKSMAGNVSVNGIY
jgi:hypothetical protein